MEQPLVEREIEQANGVLRRGIRNGDRPAGKTIESLQEQEVERLGEIQIPLDVRVWLQPTIASEGIEGGFEASTSG